MKLIRAGDILDHEGNPFVHPQFQMDAIEGNLDDIGITDVLKLYVTKAGKYKLFDGHARKGIDPDQMWPCIVTDLTESEVDTQLALFNISGAWSAIDPMKMHKIVQRAKASNIKNAAALQRVREMIADQVTVAESAENGEDTRKARRSVEGYEAKLQASVKVIIPAGDQLAVVEKALKATGIRHRGNAFAKLCQFYLDNHQE